MFIPLYDSNHLRHIKHQYVTIGLIVLNVAVYFLTSSSDEYTVQARMLGLGYIPSVAFDKAILPAELTIVPSLLTYVTYAFLHNDIFHLGGNMLFLWVFGDNVEDAMGHGRFILFFLLCGTAAGLAHAFAVPGSDRPLVGASGAVSGVVAAYLILHPRVRLWGLFFARIPLRLRAYWAIGFWLAFQLFQALTATDDSVGWYAHIGGFAAGAVLVVMLRRRDQPLLGIADEPRETRDA